MARKFLSSLPFTFIRAIPRPLSLTLIYFALAGYYYSFSRYGLNIWDEGGYAYGSLRTLHGQMAMKDFNPIGYLPGRYIFGAVLFKLFGVEIQSLRTGMVLLTPAMVLTTYFIARKIMPTGFAFLAALFTLSAPSMYYNRFFPLFCLLILFCLVRFIDRGGKRDLLWLAGSILLCLPFKTEVAVFSILISAALMAVLLKKPFSKFEGNAPSDPQTSKNKLLAGASGFLVVVLTMGGIAILAYLIQYQVPQKFINIILKTREVWGNPLPDIFPFFYLLNKLGPHEMFERILFYCPIIVYLLTLVVLSARIMREKKAVSKDTLYIFTILSFGICAFGLVIWRAGFDNLLRTLPPFYILLCYLLYRVKLILADHQWFGKQQNNFLGRANKTALNVLIVFFPFLFFYEMNVHHGFYAGSVGASNIKPVVRLKLDRLEVYTNPQEAHWVKEIVSRINRHSKKGDPIYAVPLNPIFYFLTDRINPTVHDWILPGMLDTEGQKKVVEDLKKMQPKLVVLSDIAIDGREERRFSNYAPIIFRYLKSNYEFRETVGLFFILMPKN